MKREFVFRKEEAFEGWACSNCGWVYPNPSLGLRSKEHAEFVQEKFEAHECAEYPKAKRKAASN
jgi:rubredoxin